jgi:RNA polymerase sigma-70 factor, ECF subfamily
MRESEGKKVTSGESPALFAVKPARRPEGDPMAAPSASHEVTKLLRAWSDGDAAALDRLIPLVYAELHRRARRYMRRERVGHTLQTTALVHEAYLKLIDAQGVRWQDRGHFFAIAARVMRRVLVDFARERGFQKRGGAARRVSFDETLALGEAPDTDVVALDEALGALAEIDSRKARVVELRFFGGLSIEETAEALEVSPETVRRDWRLAKSWLLRRLGEAEPG